MSQLKRQTFTNREKRGGAHVMFPSPLRQLSWQDESFPAATGKQHGAENLTNKGMRDCKATELTGP